MEGWQGLGYCDGLDRGVSHFRGSQDGPASQVGRLSLVAVYPPAPTSFILQHSCHGQVRFHEAASATWAEDKDTPHPHPDGVRPDVLPLPDARLSCDDGHTCTQVCCCRFTKVGGKAGSEPPAADMRPRKESPKLPEQRASWSCAETVISGGNALARLDTTDFHPVSPPCRLCRPRDGATHVVSAPRGRVC